MSSKLAKTKQNKTKEDKTRLLSFKGHGQPGRLEACSDRGQGYKLSLSASFSAWLLYDNSS
jgi:hypothetical protein